MSIIITYFSMLVFFVIAEIVVLTNIMQPLFKKHIGFLMNEETNFSIAAIFYLIYVAGVFWDQIRIHSNYNTIWSFPWTISVWNI